MNSTHYKTLNPSTKKSGSMSAKWRALQHRHRYTYSSIIFPPSFIQTLNQIPPETISSDFFTTLRNFISLTSTYSQISAAKDLAAAFSRLLTSAAPEPLSAAVRLYLEILFLENSLPLHRTLISALVKAKNSLPLIQSCFRSLCGEYGCASSVGKRRFLVSRAVLSLMGYPKLGFLSDALEDSAELAALDVVTGLGRVISDVNEGSRPSPVVMEQCQEALSCLYYLLQKFPAKFVGLDANSSVFENVFSTILSVLESSAAFSRDCLVAAGVSFCAAVQARMNHEEVCCFISRAFFGVSDGGGGNWEFSAIKMMPKGDLYSKFGDLSILSRLCLLRGILTAIPRTVLNARLIIWNTGSAWTILYDGILPELCKYCGNPIDSHFNFHALTVMQICLQQIKTLIMADLSDFSGDYDPINEEMSSRILRIIWNNLEDPLSQTVKQVHLIFDLLLDIKSSLALIRDGAERKKVFLHKIAADLLKLGPRCKGRYVPLASLTRRLGAESLLQLNPKLLFETNYAYADDDVCCSATSFLKCFLECLRDECWSNCGIERGYETFRGIFLPPLLQGLVSGNSKLRSNLNTYALPAVLSVDVDSIFPMLGFISVGPSREEKNFTAELTIDQCVAALVSLFKVSRSLALIEGDIDVDHESLDHNLKEDHVAMVCVKGIAFKVPVKWFTFALTHTEESIRIDAAESLFLNPKTASLPSSLELSLMKEAIPLNMRSASTAFQMKWTSMFRKFFSRVRTALERQVKQGFWQPIKSSSGNVDSNGDDVEDSEAHAAESLFHFMKWLSCFLFYSCYPSAPYERKIMAMELILVMMDVWPPCTPRQGTHHLYPYMEEFTSADSTLLLVGSIIDSWDRLRESSFRILLCFPTPLPGISSQDSLIEVIRWAKKLVCSPRVRESDAGALTFRLIFRKYVLELGWSVEVCSIICLSSKQKSRNGELQTPNFRAPVVEYILSLIQWLNSVVEEGEKDLSEACRNSFVHGVLLTLRYTFEELEWNSEVVLSNRSEMQFLLEELLELVKRITALALWVVSADALSIPYDMDDVVEDDAFLTDFPVEVQAPESLPENGGKEEKFEDIGKPAAQVVMVGCWLAMKEVSLLLGTIIRKIPLPSCSQSDSLNSVLCHNNTDTVHISSALDVMLDLKQLETIGNHFLQVLLKMKHNGAIDKTRAGFTALCNRLLCSNDPRLCKMTETWMEQLMGRTIAKGQTVDDLLRRSAGIPAAFIAFFLAEPEGTPKKLLPRALRFIIDVANKSLCLKSNDDRPNREAQLEGYVEDSYGQSETVKKEMDADNKASKNRDEGVVPTVHAFNVLRATFNDTNLAADTSGFCAEALIISIRAFSSPYWEVRNSACLAYTALVRRMIGFLNVQKRESARRALTGLEFFHRYPALHAFLFSELKVATELLEDGYSSRVESSIANAIHPSLCPILILLSRLKPSLICCETEDALDPFLFMPFIRRCATQSNLKVRVLASRALTGLVSNEKLLAVVSEIAHCLPCGQHQMQKPASLASVFLKSVSLANGRTEGTRPTFNSIHGALLQVSSLLDSNCRNLADATKKDQILGELIQVFFTCSWIGSMRTCPCPMLNSAYILVLDQMLGIARSWASSKHLATIQALLHELSSECLGMEQYSGVAWHDPTKPELRRQAVASNFHCLLGEKPNEPEESFQLQSYSKPALCASKMPVVDISVAGLHEQVLSCISDASYEVRIETLKKLFQLVKCLKTGNAAEVFHIWARNHLLSTLMQLLAVEENPKCLYYCLKIVFSWRLQQSEEPTNLECRENTCDIGSVFCFWNRLVHLNNIVRRMKTREILLCCMGLCVKQFARLLRSSIFINQERNREFACENGRENITEEGLEVYKCIESFVVLVKQRSLPVEPVNMRKAAAESIVASGLLEEATWVASLVSDNHMVDELHYHDTKEETSEIANLDVCDLYACRIIDLWFTCIQLLEDEDVGLRQKLANDVQAFINCGGSNTPSQVDRVIRSSFEFLCSTFGHWLKYFDYLLRFVFDTAASASAHRDLVRQIFEKEIDNHHEEKLLICQICCLELERLLDSKPWTARLCSDNQTRSNLKVFLQEWRLKLVHQLASFLNNNSENCGRADWIGGLGNHKDTFTSLYASLLGLYALRNSPTEVCHSLEEVSDFHKLCTSEFTQLRRVIGAYLSNPLISNLYSLVIKTYEEVLGLKPDRELVNNLVLNNFDPYFLLR